MRLAKALAPKKLVRPQALGSSPHLLSPAFPKDSEPKKLLRPTLRQPRQGYLGLRGLAASFGLNEDGAGKENSTTDYF